MTQKTFDGQTARFLAVVSENMPRLTGNDMQKWMENPAALGRILDFALQAPYLESGPLSKVKRPPLQYVTFSDEEFGESTEFLKQAVIDLHFRIEPSISGNDFPVLFRPWLGFSGGDLKKDLYVEAEHRFPDREKFGLKFDSRLVLNCILLSGSLTELLYQFEEEYTQKFVEYVKKNLVRRLSAKREPSRWKLELKFLDNKAAWFTTSFIVYDEQWQAHL